MPILKNAAAALTIVADVASYRLRKREMGNLFAALSIMVALGNGGRDILVRLAFAFVLNILVYLVNDLYDLDLDMQAAGRDREKVARLARNRGTALVTAGLLAAGLAAWALLYAPGLLVPLLGGAGVCWVYSAWLKRVPVADVLSMVAWGGLMPTVGIAIDSPAGWLLVGQLALFSACFETIQVLRDRESDQAAGMTTTAVLLGRRRTSLLLRGLIVLSCAYCIMLLHYVFGACMLVAVAVPIPAGRIDEYWNRIRLILGLGWLALLVQFFLHRSPLGLVYATLPLLGA